MLVNSFCGIVYRPPPAQAQAQPAQAHAQAQAHDEPPPPLLLLPVDLKVLEDVFGGGLVLRVTPDVKVVILPTTPAEKAVTVFATEAAASEPGNRGSVMVFDLPLDGAVGLPLTALPILRPVELGCLIPGVVRHHQ